MEALSTFMLVLSSYFPHRWKDLCQYQLLILQTNRQFASRVWHSYVDRLAFIRSTFRQHATATIWSTGPALMISFSTSTRRVLRSALRTTCHLAPRRLAILAQCSAPGAACRFAHRCSRCLGVHRASSCPGLSSDKSQAHSKRWESSPESVRSRSKSRRV